MFENNIGNGLGKTDKINPFICLLYLSFLANSRISNNNIELLNLYSALEVKHEPDLIWDERDYRDLLLDYIKGVL